MFWGRQISGEGTTQISDRILQILVTVKDVVRFRDDGPSDLGD